MADLTPDNLDSMCWVLFFIWNHETEEWVRELEQRIWFEDRDEAMEYSRRRPEFEAIMVVTK